MEKFLEDIGSEVKVEVLHADGSKGAPDRGPFDRIYFTAGTNEGFDQKPLIEQLKPNGKILIPSHRGPLVLGQKTKEGYVEKQYGNCEFLEVRAGVE